MLWQPFHLHTVCVQAMGSVEGEMASTGLPPVRASVPSDCAPRSGPATSEDRRPEDAWQLPVCSPDSASSAARSEASWTSLQVQGSPSSRSLFCVRGHLEPFSFLSFFFLSVQVNGVKSNRLQLFPCKSRRETVPSFLLPILQTPCPAKDLQKQRAWVRLCCSAKPSLPVNVSRYLFKNESAIFSLNPVP